MNRTLRLALLVTTGAALLVSCTRTGDGKDAAKTDNVAVVNGKPISRNTYNYYVKGVANGKTPEELTPEQRSELLENLIRGELIAAETEKNGLAAREETRAVLELTRLNVLQQAASQDYLNTRKATEAEVKAEYDTQVQAMPGTEFRVRHILVNTEEFANNLIRQLDRGANFAQLARKDSTDQGSRENGGELPWFTPERMVQPFSEAVLKLDPGQYTKTPVQTSYGWHVIQLEERRAMAPPPFDTVKDRITQIVEAKKFKAYTDELARTAKIERTL